MNINMLASLPALSTHLETKMGLMKLREENLEYF